MANSIDILIAAKDQASSVISGVATNADKNMKSMAESVETGLQRASLVMAGLGIGLTAYAKSANTFMVQNVTNAKNLARQTGDTVENASRLDYALQHMGVSADQTSTVFNTFSKQIQKTNEQSADAALKHATLANKIQATNEQITALTDEQKKNGDTSGTLQTKIDGLRLTIQGYQSDIASLASPLDDLNVKTKNADGSNRAFSDILLDVADKFKSMPDGVTKTTDALTLFGRQGGDMVKILDKGSDGIKALMDQADKLGITITSQNIVAVNKYIQSQKDLTDSTNSLKMQVGELTAPVMARFNTALTGMIHNFISSAGPMQNFLTYVLAFGGPFFSAAAGVAAFGSNLAGALPLMSKFTAAGKGVAAAEGMEAVASEAAILPALLNPVTVAIAAVAATAGIGYLAWKKYGQATDDAKKSTDNMGKSAWDVGTSSMPILQVSINRQKIAQEDLAKATDVVKQKQDELAASHDRVKAAQDGVAASQKAVNDTVVTYGANSPQHQQAVQTLADKQKGLDDQLWSEFDVNLRLQNAEADLAKTKDALRDATDKLNGTQSTLNGLMAGTLGVIYQFGPAAIAQINPIAQLQGAIANVVGSWNAAKVTIENQVPNVIAQLQAADSTIARVQNAANNVQRSINALPLTGGAGSLQGASGLSGRRAAGGTVQANKTYLVGEHGPELITPSASGIVIPADQTKQMMTQQTTVNYNAPIYLQTADAVKKFFQLQDQNSMLASSGMSVVRP